MSASMLKGVASRRTVSASIHNSLKIQNQIRCISISPVKPVNSTNFSRSKKEQKKYKFSYEEAYNRSFADIPTQKSPNTLDFGSYKRTSYKLKLPEDEAKKIPSILALHARLNLPQEYKYSTLVRSLTCQSTDNEFADNLNMSYFGAQLLAYYVNEHVISQYPRLPVSILKASVDAYVGDYSLYDVATNSWGIEEDKTTNLEKYLAKEPKLFKFGRLRYEKEAVQVETGITRYDTSSDFTLNRATAHANAVRSIIAGIYAHQDEAATKQFIQDHILSRKVDVGKMFEFREPGKLLTSLLRNRQMEPPVVRMISESGRQSANPVFVVGCFSGENMLGEGQGSSLAEAKTRSLINALRAFYLYRPLEPKACSDDDYKPMFVDEGESFY